MSNNSKNVINKTQRNGDTELASVYFNSTTKMKE